MSATMSTSVPLVQPLDLPRPDFGSSYPSTVGHPSDPPTSASYFTPSHETNSRLPRTLSSNSANLANATPSFSPPTSSKNEWRNIDSLESPFITREKPIKGLLPSAPIYTEHAHQIPSEHYQVYQNVTTPGSSPYAPYTSTPSSIQPYPRREINSAQSNGTHSSQDGYFYSPIPPQGYAQPALYNHEDPYSRLGRDMSYPKEDTMGWERFSGDSEGSSLGQSGSGERRLKEIGKRRHVCSVCDKRFNRPSSLNTHMSVHTGAKPFSCSQCTRRFSVSSNLRRHERTHAARMRDRRPESTLQSSTRHYPDHASYSMGQGLAPSITLPASQSFYPETYHYPRQPLYQLATPQHDDFDVTPMTPSLGGSGASSEANGTMPSGRTSSNLLTPETSYPALTGANQRATLQTPSLGLRRYQLNREPIERVIPPTTCNTYDYNHSSTSTSTAYPGYTSGRQSPLSLDTMKPYPFPSQFPSLTSPYKSDEVDRPINSNTFGMSFSIGNTGNTQNYTSTVERVQYTQQSPFQQPRTPDKACSRGVIPVSLRSSGALMESGRELLLCQSV